jgi:enoyl-CoA hydratase
MGARTEYSTVFYEEHGDGVVVLTLNRPDSGNGVVPELAEDLLRSLTDLENDSAVRCLIITGAGKQFCAGADLKAMREYLDHVLPVTNEPYNARVLFPVTQRIATSRLPIIAAINGAATAGGLDFALACDIRIASDAARMGETYINLGLPLGNGGAWFLPRLLGSGLAAELALTGDLVSASQAVDIGLVNRVVPPDQLISTAVEIGRKIAAKPWRAVEATKQALRASWQLDLTASMNASYWSVAALHHSRDLSEGVDAFLERRTPEFNRAESERQVQQQR